MKPRTYHALSEINVTNLVDVVLVLLIIFMVTAPLLQSGIDVRLPETIASAEQPSEGIIVTITKEGGVFINDVYRTADQWEDELRRVISSKPGQKAFLRADEAVGYGQVIAVLSTMKRLGLDQVGLVTQPVKEEKKTGPKIKWG
ncbi:MAG: biopolymer transporter ExbD [Candidatus Zixiibacteriota bacterium]